jgi:aminoglycoside phosphotransferase
VKHDDKIRETLPAGVQYTVLDGFSGAGIALVEEKGVGRYVRKLASEGGSDRLRRQIDRMQYFRQNVSAVGAPEVLTSGSFEGRFWVDLEFIDGADAVSYFRRAGLREVGAAVDQIVDYIREVHALAPVHSAMTLRTAVIAKIDLLGKRLADDVDASALITRLGRVAADSLPELPATLCHGDLTLENVIVDRGGRLVFIDHADPPVEHAWADLAKLDQDLVAGWYRRKSEPLNAGVRAFMTQRIHESLADMSYRQSSQALIALSMARVLPYADDDEQRLFILDRLRFLLEPSNSVGSL